MRGSTKGQIRKGVGPKSNEANATLAVQTIAVKRAPISVDEEQWWEQARVVHGWGLLMHIACGGVVV